MATSCSGASAADDRWAGAGLSARPGRISPHAALVMTRAGLVAFFSLCLLACEGKGPVLKGDYPTVRLTDRTYVIHGRNEPPSVENQGFTNNPGFVLTGKGVVVIDPGPSRQVGEMLLARIAALTADPVIAVFNTHVHGDHWLGNQAIKAAYPRAVIYAHPNMKAKAAAAGPRWVERLNRLTGGAITGTKPVVPDTYLEHDEVLKLGDRHFRSYHHDPAHTDGDLMIEVVEERVLFLGDVLVSGRLACMDDGDFPGNAEAIDLALAGGARLFVPGHGPAGGREQLLAYQHYLRTVQATVQRYYEQGLADFEMVPMVARALPAFQGWKDFSTGLGRHVSRAYRRIEAASF